MATPSQSNSRRNALGFASAVQTAFAFLQNQYGFTVAVSSSTYVRYESPKVFVNVYHGRRSYEIGLQIGLRCNEPSTETHYSIQLIATVLGAKSKDEIDHLWANTPEAVREVVFGLADITRKYAVQALTGQRGFFDELQKRQFMETQKSMRPADLARWVDWLRHQAELAWLAGDLEAARRLYVPIESELNAPELARLEYARRVTGST